MATERQVQEAVARCVATMVLYHNEKRTRHTTIMMTAEVRATAAGVSELDLGHDQADKRVIRPVEGELVARYGPDTGRKLYNDFVKAFNGSPEADPILTPFKV